MRTSPVPITPVTAGTPRARRGAAAVIAQYIHDIALTAEPDPDSRG